MTKILVIDDDADFRLAVQMVVEAHEFEMEEAATPAEGIDKVLGVEPDLVILDVMMPTDYEGFQVAREIREKHKLIDLPILMLTSVHSVKKVPYRFAPDEDYLPVDVFLDKPIEPEQLVATIQEMLGKRREEPEHPL
ncbi:MAG: response regulator [Chloroflexi bacterium]|nr:MAG: response regulator [Chloroflexota bacterium]RLC77511.1 MAG: response regulator [Chloroflexota bacterium]